MMRIDRSLFLLSSLPLVAALALTGCKSKQSEDTQNPDEVGAEGGAADGAEGGEAASSSRARGSTATRGAERRTKARKMTAKRPPRGDVEPAETEEDEGPNGLLAQGFVLDGVDALPKDFSELGDPSESFNVPNLDFDEDDAANNFPGSGLAGNYAIRFLGSINIVEEAEYELCLHSDDGSRLLLEDTLLVDNDGIHDEAVETCELVYLAPGEYMLEVDYLQYKGPLMTMHFAWAINGGDKEIVPTDVLFKPVLSGS